MKNKPIEQQFTYEEVKSAALVSRSIKEFVEKLGIKYTPNNYYKIAHKIANHYNVSLTRQDLSINAKNLVFINQIPTQEYFVDGKQRGGANLKRRMIRDLGVEEKCSICNILPEWQGVFLTLQVDHIDGNYFNNLPENLRLLCPNCHSQTDTFGKRKDTGARYVKCLDCESKIHKKAIRCNNCESNTRIKNSTYTKIDYPDINIIINNIENLGYESYGRILGVSGNAIRKYLSSREVMPLPKKLNKNERAKRQNII